MVKQQEWLEIFRAAAREQFSDDQAMVAQLVGIDQVVEIDEREWPADPILKVTIQDSRPLHSPGVHEAFQRVCGLVMNQLQGISRVQVDWGPYVAPVAPPATVVPSTLERDKAVHNERVKLNAAFFNNLAIWFAGSGAAGAMITTVLAPAPHYLAASEIGIFGVYLAFVLKLFANHEIGKLR